MSDIQSASETPPLAGLGRAYLDALLGGDREAACRLVLDAVEEGTPLPEVYLDVFASSQREVGRLWQTGRVSVAEEHYCTAATQLIMSQLYPRVLAGPRGSRTLVATCVAGDLHELGVRMVADFFAMAGWRTVYFGADTPVPDLVAALVARRADVLAVSATLGSHLPAVVELIRAVRSSPAADVRILVGGPPFAAAPGLWRRMGADGWAHDAAEAVAVAERLLSGGPEDGGGAAPTASEPAGSAGERPRSRDDEAVYDELSRLNNQLVNTQREVTHKNVELAQLNEQLAELLGIAAHDLRNPLAVIRLYSDFLHTEAGPALSPDQLEFVNAIRASSAFMVQLVDGLLDVSRIEAGRLDLDLADVDLPALAAGSVERNRVLATHRGIRLELERNGDGALPALRLDPVKIEQVLNNLIGNAIKFSPAGTTVTVRTGVSGGAPGEEGRRAVLAVSDQGPGIAADELERIFRPFERARPASERHERGVGLGLAIVKRIVEGHGGTIQVDSRQGQGSTFRIELPAGPAEG